MILTIHELVKNSYTPKLWWWPDKHKWEATSTTGWNNNTAPPKLL